MFLLSSQRASLPETARVMCLAALRDAKLHEGAAGSSRPSRSAHNSLQRPRSAEHGIKARQVHIHEMNEREGDKGTVIPGTRVAHRASGKGSGKEGGETLSP